MVKSQRYTYRVWWSNEDEAFIASVVEFPSLSFLAESQFEALEGISDLVTEVVADMEENGERVPQPFAERTYSGKFSVRIPSEVHRELALSAAEQNISLNRLVASRLAAV